MPRCASRRSRTRLHDRFGRASSAAADGPRGDRPEKLAARVFGSGNEQALRDLEAIVHPVIRRGLLAAANDLFHSGAAAILLDAAVLLETGWHDDCERRRLRGRAPAERLRRVAGRGWDEAELDRREAQPMVAGPQAGRRRRRRSTTAAGWRSPSGRLTTSLPTGASNRRPKPRSVETVPICSLPPRALPPPHRRSDVRPLSRPLPTTAMPTSTNPSKKKRASVRDRMAKTQAKLNPSSGTAPSEVPVSVENEPADQPDFAPRPPHPRRGVRPSQRRRGRCRC